MTLQSIAISESVVRTLSHTQRAAQLIDDANDRIAEFMLSDEEVIENFVNCDFHLIDLSIAWIQQNHLLTGNRFCELGSGFGVVAMLAAAASMESVGIEIEPKLVAQSSRLAEDLGLDVEFCAGSFVPRGVDNFLELASEVEHVDTHQGDVYKEIGMAMDDFDLFFAFPWPGENGFFEAVFDSSAASGALLLTYRGREGVDLKRKD